MPSSDTRAVELKDVSVNYGRIEAVKDTNLAFSHGSTVAIIGPNGSGKSTLLSLISGLIRPTHGRVVVHCANGRARRHAVAHVLQTTIANSALPITVRETVRMGTYGHLGMVRRMQAKDRTAVEDSIDRMRIGDLVNRQLHELSGGQRQRVYVAQGLAQQAPVLLLDEPITGLDLMSQETITEVIDQERDAGRTVILTTHDVGTARLADHVVLMATSPVASGPPQIALTPQTMAEAYGRHAHVLDDGTVVLDEPHHHHPVKEPGA